MILDPKRNSNSPHIVDMMRQGGLEQIIEQNSNVSENKLSESIEASPFFGNKGGISINEVAMHGLVIKSPII